MNMSKVPITVAKGDGIGPEIMDATLFILKEAGAQIEPEFIQIGEATYLSGNSAGITQEAWDSLRRTRVFLKAPITTPQGGGFKSLNVTVRKGLGLYANVRPCVAYHPYVKTKHPGMNLVIIRENEEDLYAGIEHRQTMDVVQCLKLISRPGSEKIIRYAFEYAKTNNRKKVTCFTKDNIMKMTDGLFHQIFDEISREYPDIQTEHWIVDIGMAKMAADPTAFDVIVMPNLYGDIASDIAAQIAGSVGLAGSSNVGDNAAMFEAIHGSAPRRAGQGIANPSGLLHGAIMMLVHINQPEVAARIHNAWLKTLEDGVYTYDIAGDKPWVGTMDFAKAVVERLGQDPDHLPRVAYSSLVKKVKTETFQRQALAKRNLDGVDVFVYNTQKSPDQLGDLLTGCAGPQFTLTTVCNRGIKVYPDGLPDTFCTDHWACRFEKNQADLTPADIRDLLQRIEAAGVEWVKTENLYSFDDQPGYSMGQGQ
jgi:isocitrate dehydrogenase